VEKRDGKKKLLGGDPTEMLMKGGRGSLGLIQNLHLRIQELAELFHQMMMR
jgi:hypothetical protein